MLSSIETPRNVFLLGSTGTKQECDIPHVFFFYFFSFKQQLRMYKAELRRRVEILQSVNWGWNYTTAKIHLQRTFMGRVLWEISRSQKMIGWGICDWYKWLRCSAKTSKNCLQFSVDVSLDTSCLSFQGAPTTSASCFMTVIKSDLSEVWGKAGPKGQVCCRSGGRWRFPWCADHRLQNL